MFAVISVVLRVQRQPRRVRAESGSRSADRMKISLSLAHLAEQQKTAIPGEPLAAGASLCGTRLVHTATRHSNEEFHFNVVPTVTADKQAPGYRAIRRLGDSTLHPDSARPVVDCCERFPMSPGSLPRASVQGNHAVRAFVTLWPHSETFTKARCHADIGLLSSAAMSTSITGR